MTADMIAAAIDYAGRGWPIFPVHTPIGRGCSCGNECGKNTGKHPRTAHGFEDATTDVDSIRAWWERWPEANIGLRTGVVCDVFDIDHHDQFEGTADTPWAIEMPGGPVARTGNGWHYYLSPTGLGNRTRFTEHCDWRGVGGYSILPPSLHHSGRRYEWFATATLALNAAPPDLVALLTPTAPRAAQGTTGPVKRLSVLPANRRRLSVGQWSPAGLIGRMVIAPEGERNATLVWAANRLGLDYSERKATRAQVEQAREILRTVAIAAGLNEREVAATINSGFDKGVDGRTNRSAS